MSLIKRYMAERLGRGVSAIRLRPAALKFMAGVKGHLSREQVRQLMKNHDSYAVIPKKKRSYRIVYKGPGWKQARARHRQTATPVKFKSMHFADRIKDKTISDKQRWIHHVRIARQLLRQHRSVVGKDYALLRARVKGGLYRKDLVGLRRKLRDYEG